jgi:hypothetical protein
MVLSSIRGPLKALLPGKVPLFLVISAPLLEGQCYVNLTYKARNVHEDRR